MNVRADQGPSASSSGTVSGTGSATHPRAHARAQASYAELNADLIAQARPLLLEFYRTQNKRPTHEERVALAKETGLTTDYINDWSVLQTLCLDV